MTTTPETGAADRALLACPFCACAMQIKTSAEHHVLHGPHDDDCLFFDEATLVVPAQDSLLAAMIKDWNRRAEPAAPRDRSPYILGVKPDDWDAQIAAGRAAQASAAPDAPMKCLNCGANRAIQPCKGEHWQTCPFTGFATESNKGE